MMKPYQYIISLIFAFAVLSLSACSNDDDLLQTEGENVSITFRPTLGGELSTRAIGDAAGINRLTVAVYEGSQTLSKKFSFSEDWDIVQRNGIELTLIEGRSYNILFWAENSGNSAYTISDDGRITVNYDNYIEGGFANMEEMDAFFGTSSITVGTQKVENKGEIKLSRPFAQLNFADKTIRPTQGTHKAIITFHSIPTSFNPFTGGIEMTDANNTADDFTFVFTDFPDENLIISQVPYYFVASNYLFVPASGTASIEATLDLQLRDGTSINKFEFKGEKAITLEKNKKTNVLGNIVQQPVNWSVWDGISETQPTLEQDRYVIDNAADIAWLSKKGNTLDPNKTFELTTDIDMAQKSGLSSIQLPQGSTLDGGEHTIKGLSLDGGLLGNIVNVSVQDLTIEGAAISNSNTAVTHIGVLANTLAGSATFSNVTIKKSSVSTDDGAAGGMIGYVSRISKDSRTESLNVSFDNCHVIETSVEGSISEGHFVGLLRGYDNGEILQFNNNCTLTLSATATQADDIASPYTEGNEGAWLAENDYSKYNGWLGNEECYRGMVMCGDNRFVPCWDGKTKITPLTDGDGTTKLKLIYSAFDLANCAGTNPGTIKFMENVDMGAKVFNPLTNLSKLLGENKTIYNLKVETTFNDKSWDGGGFIRRCSAATIENITFQNADVKVTHVDGTDGDAYASIVCGTAEGTNTMTNVKVIGGKLYGCNKMGGIAGYITGTFTATNCVVDGLSIQNYDSGGKDKLGFKANGEVGGAFGFLAANADISGCYVKNTTLNCVGVNNGKALIFFKYAGRHVNEFIGDIRTTSGQTIRITLDENNFTGNLYKNRRDQYSGCKYIGHCYYTYINAYIAKIEDTKGTVYVNNKSITVVENY